MRNLGHVVLALFRPAKGVDGAAPLLKWLWLPLAALLLVSVAAKTWVATPLSLAASQEAVQAEMTKALETMPDEEKKAAEEAQSVAQELDGAGSAIITTSAMVFGVLGGAMGIVFVATFFFIAAKTWANPVGYVTMLSVAALSSVPRAIGNLVQAVYMSATGVWLQHPGLGALVAPEKVMDAPPASYAFLSQVDIWVIWGLAILFGALASKTVGIERKRVVVGMLAFVVVAGILRAVPTLITAAFMGGGVAI